MMRLTLLLLPLLAGCTMATSHSSARYQEELQRDLAGLVPGAPQDCVSAPTSSESLRAVDSRTIRYRQGRTIWVNRLPSECPGLRPLTTLVVEVHGAQYCRGDHIRTLEPGDVAPGPVCALGQFTPYRPPSS